MTIKIKVADSSSESRVYGMVAGPAGIGKTTQLTTFPKDSSLGISIEDGFLSIKGSGARYIEVDNYQELMDFLTKDINSAPYSWVKYIFVDSLTEMYDMIKKEAKDKYSAAQNFAKHDEVQSKVLYLLRVLRQMTDKSVFFTCHTKEEKNGMVLEENLAFDGKFPEAVKKQFDLIVHMKSVQFDGHAEKMRCFVTSPDISKIAKRRVSPWLGIQVGDYEEPNLFNLTQKLLGR